MRQIHECVSPILLLEVYLLYSFMFLLFSWEKRIKKASKHQSITSNKFLFMFKSYCKIHKKRVKMRRNCCHNNWVKYLLKEEHLLLFCCVNKMRSQGFEGWNSWSWGLNFNFFWSFNFFLDKFVLKSRKSEQLSKKSSKKKNF